MEGHPEDPAKYKGSLQIVTISNKKSLVISSNNNFEYFSRCMNAPI